jgi:mono/diheme cytochrome c family protein
VRWLFVALLLLCASARAAEPAVAPSDFFEQSIRPVFAEHCYECHSAQAKKLKGGLRLDQPEEILAGGDSGAAVVPGNPDASLLVKAIRYTDPDFQMPPKDQPLAKADVVLIETWVRMGAPIPKASPLASASKLQAAANHWAFQPVKMPALPGAKNSRWIKTPVDAFILSKLQAKKLRPAPEADRRTLIRRVYYDLTGLPPPYGEVCAFVQDKSPDAYSRLVERLLDSPPYGERWGRYWLDIARYADTKGYLVSGQERRFPFSYTYRDYVVRAFNEDKPYDQFLLEQIAADKLVGPSGHQTLAALGFLTLGRGFLGNQNDIIDDRIDVVTRGAMALTVTCARCHDHKFDPISTRDYYALHGVFASSEEPAEEPLLGPPPDSDDYHKYLKEKERLEKEMADYREKEITSYLATNHVTRQEAETTLARKLGEGVVPWENKIKALAWTHPGAPARAMALEDKPTPGNSHILKRGNPSNPGDEVPRRFLDILSRPAPQPFTNGSGRLELARAIVSPANPLTARVYVNRVWQHHFGEGLVPTAGDFGVRTEAPLHRELLDYLAADFMEHGWSTKRLHRLILLSSTYRQSSDASDATVRADPDNHLYARMNRQRLDFEALRDTLLALSGRLDPKLGGQPVDILAEPFSPRRTLYGFIDRQNLPGVFRTFDFANPDLSNQGRFRTTVPQQALFLMNSPFVLEQARALVTREEVCGLTAPEQQLRALAHVVLQRDPTPDELRIGLQFLLHEHQPNQKLSPLETYAQALLLSNEVMFVD